MFLFIDYPDWNLEVEPLFKYISCSYLSGDEKTWRKYCEDLNTSHVLIYRSSGKRYNVQSLQFKYISCSYLSFLALYSAFLQSFI